MLNISPVINLKGMGLPTSNARYRTTTHPSDHCSAILSCYHALDRTTWGRAAINISHITIRNLASVMLPTVLRQTVGNLLDHALKQGFNEARRTALGAVFMAVPVAGQLMIGVADELQGRSSNYSRATRAVMMGLSLATGGAALATQSMINPGMRFAEAILYPVLRDLIQTALPVISNPEAGPTKKSLLIAGTLYAANQLGVSRGFVSLPDWIAQIGVEKGFHLPLPPNCTCSFPAYSSPVDSFFIEIGLPVHELP